MKKLTWITRWFTNQGSQRTELIKVTEKDAELQFDQDALGLQLEKTNESGQNFDYQGWGAANIANKLEQTQISKFHTKGGHGFAAEDANALVNKLQFQRVEMTGRNNSLNGPDRIVDNVAIQTKYYQTSRQTVNAAFDSQTGFYRYQNQLLEVPSDQYEDCVDLVRQKILQGKVPGIADPGDAELIVKKGIVTYRQARNIAQAGNIDSLVYDVKTQAVSISYLFAISFAIQFARGVWEGQNRQDAVKHALSSAISAGSASFVTGVIAAQILRSRVAVMGTIAFRGMLKSTSSTVMGKAAIENAALASLGRGVYGAAAINHIAKLLRSNVITSIIMTGVFSIPDFYRARVSRQISWKQFGKNLVVNILSVIGGITGWLGGAAFGVVVGSIVPILGTIVLGFIGGLLGALAVSLIVSIIAKFILDRFVEDDEKQMLRIVNRALEEAVFDFLLTPNEIGELIVKCKEKIKLGWLQDIYKIGCLSKDSDEKRKNFAYSHFDLICQEIVSKRLIVSLPEPDFVIQELDKMLAE